MSRNKIVPLGRLSEFVPDGSLVGLGGAWLSNHPMAAVRQLVRDGRKIPGFLVDAVIEAPFGAHPLTHVPCYGLDAWELRDYAAAAADPGAWPAYLQRLRTETEQEYRARVLPPGRARVVRNLARAGRVLEAAAS
jgi:hypothetical protein